MPTYAFACRKCGKGFAVTMLISEHGKKKARCPKCDSGHVVQQVTAFYAQTKKKS